MGRRIIVGKGFEGDGSRDTDTDTDTDGTGKYYIRRIQLNYSSYIYLIKWQLRLQ